MPPIDVLKSTSSKHAFNCILCPHAKGYVPVVLHYYSTCIIVGSPTRAFERRDDDDLPTIAEEEALSNELTSEV